MQYTIAAAALLATASASKLVRKSTANFNAEANVNLPYAKVVNRCSYDVYLWSIEKELGCNSDVAFKLGQGETYTENYRSNTSGGVSIKMSKTDTCGGKDITQLEYKINTCADSASGCVQGNFLDMSFVDCTDNLDECPGRTDGFYMKTGNSNGKFLSAVNNEHCPIFNVYNAEEAAKVSYINWDDRQTKYCNEDANMELYLCGGEAPGAEDSSSSSAAPSSSEAESSSAPEPTSTVAASSSSSSSSSSEDAFVVAAAAVTEAPKVPAAAPVVKTEVVYVTEYVNKRHAHGRRHQHYRA